MREIIIEKGIQYIKQPLKECRMDERIWFMFCLISLGVGFVGGGIIL